MMEPIVWHKMNDLLWKKDLRVKQLEKIDAKIRELQIQKEEIRNSLSRLWNEIRKEEQNKGVRQ